jgi:hypothetical protein
MTEDAAIKRALEAVLEKINALGHMFDTRIATLEQQVKDLSDLTDARFSSIDSRFNAVGIRLRGMDGYLDRIASAVFELRASIHELSEAIRPRDDL